MSPASRRAAAATGKRPTTPPFDANRWSAKEPKCRQPPNLIWPVKVGIALLVVPGVLDLTQQQGRIVDAEIHAVAVARPADHPVQGRLVAVEDPAENGELFGHVDQ